MCTDHKLIGHLLSSEPIRYLLGDPKLVPVVVPKADVFDPNIVKFCQYN